MASKDSGKGSDKSSKADKALANHIASKHGGKVISEGDTVKVSFLGKKS
jgi:hypothetical protein